MVEEQIAEAVFKSLNKEIDLKDYGLKSWIELYTATVDSEQGNEPSRYGFEYWEKEIEYSIFEDLSLESHRARFQLRAMYAAVELFATYVANGLVK